ncbi:hypothetical protein [Paraburkholderia lycopersici]|uniref:Protocatechuate 4,5-dioxygenase, alpha chain n=1 Tax=Paraburkholderia lycopersici TaxID=416944 RepID=A0A1G6LY76_9BURK|nr:hypothetical protein [Paraburkholderia lycopersici]SDC47685.1 hypothetical protein SAMN05421548_10764 [Paraburkholderia lycopersici]
MTVQLLSPPVELHRLISAALRDNALADLIRTAPDEAYSAYQVPAWQQELLVADLGDAMNRIGVHPNLRFKFLALRGLLKLQSASVAPFLESLGGKNGSYR